MQSRLRSIFLKIKKKIRLTYIFQMRVSKVIELLLSFNKDIFFLTWIIS